MINMLEKFLNKKIIISLLISFIFAASAVKVVKAQTQVAQQEFAIHLFTSSTCPHCQKEKDFLLNFKKSNPDIKIYNYEIDERQNGLLMSAVAKELDTNSNGVPLTVIGNQSVLGFASASTTGEYIKELFFEEIEQNDALDVAAIARQNNLRPERVEIGADIFPYVTMEPSSAEEPQPANQPTEIGSVTEIPTPSANYEDEQNGLTKKKGIDHQLEQTISLPVIGEKKVSSFSLPVLTFVVGFLDGFNPCAMWTLLFLISLLLGLEDKKRMWILGMAFIVASSFVYFLFMSAWLNLFLFIGFIGWVRILIGAVSLGAGGYYLYDYCVNKTGACKVDMGGKKQKVFAKLKEFTHKQSLFAALVGIVLLAFAVNLVELICSAGLPAVYTQVLSMSDLPTWEYYLYLIAYIVVFMLDDLFVFFVAMKTLHKVGVNTKYSRYSHLIGGILMLGIGLALWFKPELLTFG